MQMGTPAPPLLLLRRVTKRFGGVMALVGVDFDGRAGEIHALLGENGAGNSGVASATPPKTRLRGGDDSGWSP
jgi:ABC-type sugar transport system ATPase subunit